MASLSNELMQTLWIGDSLSKIEFLCLQSFINKGHPVHLYCYNHVQNVPDKVVIKNANEIVSKDKLFHYKGSYAIFSDLFRFQLLYNQGGYWIDTDMFCLKPFDFQDEIVMGFEFENSINTAVIRLPRKHFIAEYMLENFQNPWRCIEIKPYLNFPLLGSLEKLMRRGRFQLKTNLLGSEYKKELYGYVRWGHLGGPGALNKVFQKYPKKFKVLPQNYFYKVLLDEWWAIFYDSAFELKIDLTDAYGIHLWSSRFKHYRFFDKNMTFQEGSLMYKLSQTESLD